MKPVTIFLLGMVLAPVSFAAAPALLQPHFTVELHVEVSDASKEAVVSDITNALKQLKDVDVRTDGTGLWVLYINLAPITDQKGLKGYAISTVISDQNSSQTIRSLSSEDFAAPAVEHAIKELAKGQVDIHEHLVITCTTDGLSKAYAHIVDYFNENYLMPAREDIDNYNAVREPARE